MPELPDVELFKRHLDATCLGRSIRGVIITDTRILAGASASELAQRLEGARIVKSLRHGKHLLVHLGPPGWLTMHFGMNGSLRHFEDGEDDPPYDRLRLDFADGHHLAYVNPRLLGRVGPARDAAEFIAAQRLGPDALDPRFDLAAFERAIAGRKRDVKSVLMDQEVVAGIGNIYSDEILFRPASTRGRVPIGSTPARASACTGRSRRYWKLQQRAAPAQSDSSTACRALF
jgi:formamidopyrimidine-DNA glycosylase